MFTDGTRCRVWERISRLGLDAFAHILTPRRLTEAAGRAGVTPGNGPLNRLNLAWLAVAAALHRTRTFADVLTLTVKILRDAEVGRDPFPPAATDPQPSHRAPRRSRHDPRRDDPTVVSEEAFVKARKAMPPAYWAALLVLLTDGFEQEHAAAVRFRRFRLLALDGTCLDLPGRAALAGHFGTATNGKSRGTVQARLVMLQFPLTRLPWRYELAPLAQGERTVAARLLRDLRPDDLVLMDQGFWSYGRFQQVQGRGAYFAIRLYPGVKFQAVRRLGPEDSLKRWTPSDRRRRQRGLPESMELRVIPYQIRGFRPSAVVTNVTDPEAISRAEWVGLAADKEAGRPLRGGLYHRRWEIETTFLEWKVWQGTEKGLRSRTPEGVIDEVAGHVLLYLLMRWLMVEAAAEAGVDPLRLSFVEALRELSDLVVLGIISSPVHVAQVLLPRLRQRIAGHIVPERPGRHYPRPHDTQVLNKGKGKRRIPHKLKAA